MKTTRGLGQSSLCLLVILISSAAWAQPDATVPSTADAWRAAAVWHAEQIQDKSLAEDVFYDLVYVQGRAGDLAGAAASAGRVTGLQRYVYARINVAKQAAKQGDMVLCRQSLQLAQDKAVEQLITNNPRVHNPLSPIYYGRLADIVRAYGELGLEDEARALIQKLPHANERAVAADDLAKAIATRNNPQAEQADQQTLWFPSDPRAERIKELKNRFDEQIKAEQAEAAAATIEALVKYVQDNPQPDVHSKFGKFDDEALIAAARQNYVQTAGLLLKRGDRAGALAHVSVARQAIFGLPESATLVKWFGQSFVIHGYIGIGELATARELVAATESEFTRATLAAKLAVAQVKAGDVPAAIEMSRLISAQGSHDNPLGEVVAALIRHGDLTAARTMIGRLGDTAADARAMREVGKAMIETGREKELQDWLAKIEPPAQQAYAAMGAAEQLAKTADQK
jgi:hypothetical protein